MRDRATYHGDCKSPYSAPADCKSAGTGAVASFVASTTGIMTDKLPKAWQVTCMVAAGGLSGGVTATMAGGYFWDGVCNGLICSGLNHAMHLACETMEGPDDPPGSKKNNAQQLKGRAQNASTVVGAEATMVEKAAELTNFALATKEMKPIIKYAKLAGKLCIGVDICTNLIKAYKGEISLDVALSKITMTIVEYGSFEIPIVGPAIGAGLIYSDVTGKFDNTLYNDAWLKEYFTPRYSKYNYMPPYIQYY